jgi:hypothetical protein
MESAGTNRRIMREDCTPTANPQLAKTKQQV